MTPLPYTQHSVSCLIYWPARASIAPFSMDIGNPAAGAVPRVVVTYEPLLGIGGESFVAQAWTKLVLSFPFKFEGDAAAFADWARTDNGTRRLLDEAVKIQNLVIDHIKAAHAYDAQIGNVRHFGPAEWPYVRCDSGGTLLFHVANAGLRAAIASAPLVVALPKLAAGEELSFAARSLLRALDLVDCGYPTEALLIGAALLDATVQDALMTGMQKVGVQKDSADALLRNTTQKRLATYMDPVLKLVHGRSLREDDPDLFSRMLSVNTARNDAIHNGIEVHRSTARDALVCVFDVLDYLRSCSGMQISLPPRPPSK